MSNIPQGALMRAQNVVIDRDGIIEPSRGFVQYGPIGENDDRAKQILDYKSRLLVHYTDKLAYDNDAGTFTALKKTYSEVDSGLRIKYIEFNGNLYITTNEGIKKVATTATNSFPSLEAIEEVDAGGVKAADLEAFPDYTVIGFLTEYSKVSYRVVWLRRDINNNLIIGYPSARFEVVNPTNKSCQVKLNITIPLDIVSGYEDTPKSEFFYQVYRSSIAQSAEPFSLENLNLVSSNDEMRLVYEDYPSETQLDNKLITFTDIVTDDYRNGGANLYTNEISGDGIAQANFRPPISKDIALYKNTAFFSNTKTYHNMNMTLTGIGNMREINDIWQIFYNVDPITDEATTIIYFDSPHGLLVGDYFVLQGVNPNKPNHYLNNTWQVYEAGTNTIKIQTEDWTTDPVFASSASIYTSYISINKGLSNEEKYFFVGRQAIERATFTAKPTAGSYITFSSIGSIQKYCLWFEAITPAVKAKYTLTFPADVSGSLNNKYFYLNTADNKSYYIWYSVNGAGSDPQLTRSTGIKVDLSTNATANSVTIATHSSLKNVSDFIIPDTLTAGVTTFQVENSLAGNCLNPSVGTMPLGFTAVVNTPGVNAIPNGTNPNLGIEYIDIKVSFETTDTMEDILTNISNTITESSYDFELENIIIKEKYTISFVGNDIAPGGLASKYFTLNTSDGKGYYVWYMVDGVGTDPALSERIGLVVNISSSSTSSAVTLATYNVLLPISDFTLPSTLPSGATQFIVENTLGGFATDPSIGTTPFGIGINTQGAWRILFKSPVSGAFTLSEFTTSSSPVSNITFSIEQEGYGENSTKKYVRWGSVTETTTTSYSVLLEDTARSLVKVINKSSQIIDASYESTAEDIPGKMFFEALTLDNSGFSLIATPEIGSSFSPDLTTKYDSTNEVSPNRIYYSKTNEPEHVPKLNYIDIGPKDKQIIRIVGLQDSLFIFKEEGIYRLTGENSSNFNIKLHDSSGTLVAPDSIAVLNNQIYCFTAQGIVAVSEAGMNIISRPIENVILKARENTNFSQYTFGISSETDRALLIFTTEDKIDTSATIVYRYNIFTRAWTSLTKSATCGVLNTRNNKFFLGASDLNLVEEERKTYTRRDFAGRKYDINFLKNTKVNNSIKISSSTNVDIGDIIVQTQYLTISFFNRLLARLDIDPGIKDPNNPTFFSSLAAVPGDDLNEKILELQDLLLSKDASGGYDYSSELSLQEMQSKFNTGIIDKLNDSDKVLFPNYEYSTGITDYELRIDDLQSGINKITADNFLPVIVGECVVHKYIPTDVVWAPQHFGEPNTLKHVRESTIMFEDTAFTKGYYGFNTDLSGNFESIQFSMTGDGLWGMDPYDTNPWGGVGMAVPFRTYIPRQKQRCRFIRSRFETKSAFTKFAILGVSYVFEVSSERAYK